MRVSLVSAKKLSSSTASPHASTHDSISVPLREVHTATLTTIAMQAVTKLVVATTGVIDEDDIPSDVRAAFLIHDCKPLLLTAAEVA